TSGKPCNVIVNAGTDVESCDVNRTRLRGETEPEKRVDCRKRLKRLNRIEIVAGAFVRKIETGPDDGHAPDAVRQNKTLVLHRLEGLFDSETGEYRCIQRQTAASKQPGLDHHLVSEIAGLERVFPLGKLPPFRQNALSLFLKMLF